MCLEVATDNISSSLLAQIESLNVVDEVMVRFKERELNISWIGSQKAAKVLLGEQISIVQLETVRDTDYLVNPTSVRRRYTNAAITLLVRTNCVESIV